MLDYLLHTCYVNSAKAFANEAFAPPTDTIVSGLNGSHAGTSTAATASSSHSNGLERDVEMDDSTEASNEASLSVAPGASETHAGLKEMINRAEIRHRESSSDL